MAAAHPFTAVAGVVIDIAKYCIESGLAEPVDTVVAVDAIHEGEATDAP